MARGLCGLPCKFLAGQEASTKTLCPSQTAAEGPQGAQTGLIAHSPLTARPVAWSPATPGECGTCGTEVRKGGPSGPHCGPSSHRPRV